MADTFQKKTDQDLNKMLIEKRTKLRDLRFDVAGASSKDTKEQMNLRKDIARILTELRARQLNA